MARRRPPQSVTRPPPRLLSGAYQITPDAPSGGPGAAFYSVSPALPAGLVLNSGTGIISGAPTVVTAQTSLYRDGLRVGRQHSHNTDD